MRAIQRLLFGWGWMVALAVLGMPPLAHAVNRTSNQLSGNWTAGTSWIGGVAPANDLTSDWGIINNGATITVDAPRSVGGVFVGSGTGTARNINNNLTIGALNWYNGTSFFVGDTLCAAVVSQAPGITVSCGGKMSIAPNNGTVSTTYTLGAGATLNANNGLWIGNNTAGGSGGVGALTVNGGTVNVTASQLWMGRAGTGSATLTLNSGSTLSTLAFSGFAGTATLNLNGGTIQIRTGGGGASFLPAGATMNVQNGGVTVDNNGVAGTVVGALLNAGTGGLTKIGAGTLTLSGANTYAGGTTISAGTALAANASAFGPGTITLNGGTLDMSTYSFANAVTLNNTVNTIWVNGAYRILSGKVSGAGGFTVGGINTPGLNLSNTANDFSGNITVNAGTYLQVGTTTVGEVIPDTCTVTVNGHLRLEQNTGVETLAGLSGNGVVWRPAGSTGTYDLRVGSAANSTFDGAIGSAIQNNNLKLTKIGAGTLTLTGANLYTDTTTISDGTLQIGNGGATGQPGTGAIVNNAALVVNRSNAITVGNAISGTGTLTKEGGGTLTLTANNGYAGATTVNGGTLAFSGSGTIPAANAIAVNNGGTLSFTRNDTWGNDATLASAAVTVNSGGTLSPGGYFNTLWNPALNDGKVLLNGGLSSSYPAFQIAGTLTATGTASIVVGTGNNNVINIGGKGNSTLTVNTPNATDTVTNNAPFQSNWQAVGVLAKTGPGTFTLTATNTYAGATTISAGTLAIGGAGLLGNGSYAGTIANAGSFVYGSSTNQLLNGTFSGVGTATKAGTGTLTLSGTGIIYTGPTTISGGTLALSAATLYASPTTTVAAGGTLELTNTSTTVDNWPINTLLAGSGTINKTGAGWIQTPSTKVHTFSGALNIQSGIFGAYGLGSVWTGISADVNVWPGALLDARGQAITVGSLNGTGTVGTTWSTAATLNVGAGNKSGSFAGSIQGNNTSGVTLPGNPNASALSLVKIGTGTQTLSGTNTYSGNTTVSAGTLAVTGVLTGAVAGARFIVNGTAVNNPSLTFDMGTGTSTFYGDGWANACDIGESGNTGALTLESGTLNIGTRTAGTYGSIRLGVAGAANGTLTVNGGTLNIPGRILLGANNTAAVGTLTINGGQVNLGTPGLYNSGTDPGNGIIATGSGTSIVNLNSGGALSMYGFSSLYLDDVDSKLNFNGGTLLAVANNSDFTPRILTLVAKSGGARVDTQGYAITITKAITHDSALGATPDGGLTKIGAGTLTLAGAGTYTGGTIIRQDTLALNGYAAAAGTGGITLTDSSTGANNVALLLGTAFPASTYAANSLTVANNGSGTVTIGSDNSALVNIGFSGTLTLSKDVTLQAGTSDRTTFSNQIAGTGNLTIASPFAANRGVVFDRTSGAANNFTGSITLGASADLQLGVGTSIGNRTIPDAAGVSFNSGARLRFSPTGSGDGETVGTLSSLVAGAGTVDMITGTAFTLTVGGDNGTDTFSGTIGNSAGTLGLAKIGTGMQILSGLNTYGGSTTISAGTLQIGDGGTSGQLAGGAIVDNAALVINRSDALSMANVISGNGSVTKTGAGALTLSATTSSVTGDVSIVQGSVVAGAGHNDGAAGSVLGAVNVARSVNVSPGATLSFGASDVFGNNHAYPVLTLAVTGGTITNSGNFVTLGPVVLNGASMAGSGLIAAYQVYCLNGAVRVIGSSPSTMSSSGTYAGYHLAPSTTFDVNNVTSDASVDLTVSAPVLNQPGGHGAGSLTKTGAGTLRLSNANIYTGGTIISAGTAQAGNASAFGTGAITLDGGTLDLDVYSLANSIVLNNTANAISVNGNFRVLSGKLSGAGGFTADGINVAGLTLGNPANDFAGSVTIKADVRLVTSVSEVLPDTAVVNVNANGNLRFDANNGVETIAGLAGTGNGLVWRPTTSSGTFNLLVGAGDTTSSFPGSIGISGQNTDITVTKIGDGTLTLSGGTSRFTGDLIVSQGTVIASGTTGGTNPSQGSLGNPQTARAIQVASGATLRLAANDILGNALSAPITTFSISGLVENTGVINVLRNPTLAGGELRANGGSSPSYPAYMLRGTVSVTGGAPSQITATGSVNGNTQIQLGDNTAGGVTVFDVTDVTGNGSADLTVSAALQNSRNSGGSAVASGLTKTSAGTMVRAGTDTYTGATTVSAGTLLVNGAHATGSDYSVNSGVLGGAGTIGGAGTVAVASGATLTAGDIDSTGTLRINKPVSLQAGSTLLVNLQSGACDRIDMSGGTGTFAPGGANLQIEVTPSTYVPAVGTEFDLVSGFTGSLGSTFNNLPDGTEIRLGAAFYAIRYDEPGHRIFLSALPGRTVFSFQ